MRHGILKSVAGMGLGFALAAGAHAELLNISSNSLQSQNTPAIACAIVGAGGVTRSDGYKVLVILAEGKASDSNPRLTVKTSDGYIGDNDNWGSASTQNRGQSPWQAYPATWLGRNPGRDSDSGMVIGISPGRSVCAYSYEVSGGDTLRPVAISITDVTSQDATARSQALSAPVNAPTYAETGVPQ